MHHLLLNKNSYTLLLCLIIFLGIALLHISCKQNKDQKIAESYQGNSMSGRELAKIHCGSCHLPVSPDMLDKKTWTNGVLPAMAPKFGIRVWRQNKYYPAGGGQGESLSFAKWTKIVNYFKKEAPETLQSAKSPVLLNKNDELFTVEQPAVDDKSAPVAATTLVKIDPQSGTIYTSGANDNALIRWNADLTSTKSLQMESPAVDLNFANDFKESRKAVLTTIGTMQAADILQGKVQEIKLESNTANELNMIGTKLNRPLQARSADFNKDGRDDWVIAEFGHDAGGLYLHEQQDDQTFQKKPIWEVPGAEDIGIDDFNGDGWPDLMVLFGYSDEGIWLFTNDKKGGFDKENILRFPAVYGSTSFELADMNGDGLKDIIYTNGDNADFSPILKPYHGLRIYLNKGDNKFEKSYFYPINGATKAVVKDFDQDGDKDIATIAFFADFEQHPEESFIYFENEGSLEFRPRTASIEKLGRWIAMDAGDVDGDGDIDIVLGNFSVAFLTESGLDPSWDTKMPFILLKNNLRYSNE